MQIFDSKEKVIKIFTFQQFCIPLLTLVHLMDQISYPPPPSVCLLAVRVCPRWLWSRIFWLRDQCLHHPMCPAETDPIKTGSATSTTIVSNHEVSEVRNSALCNMLNRAANYAELMSLFSLGELTAMLWVLPLSLTCHECCHLLVFSISLNNTVYVDLSFFCKPVFSFTAVLFVGFMCRNW